jgi:hypothetical protein
VVNLEENKENETEKREEESRKDKEKKQRKGLNKLFDYNPITNYFNYNQKAELKQVDQKLIEDNEYIRQAFEKYNLKRCNVNLVDCFGTGLLYRTESTIKITDEIKQKLGIVDQSEVNCTILNNSKKTRKSITKGDKKLTKKKKSITISKLFEIQNRSNLEMTIKDVSLETTSFNSEANNDFGQLSSIKIISNKKRGRKRKILDMSLNLNNSNSFINLNKSEVINVDEEVFEIDSKEKQSSEIDDEIIELDCPHQSLELNNFPIESNRKLDNNNSLINTLTNPRKRLKCKHEKYFGYDIMDMI